MMLLARRSSLFPFGTSLRGEGIQIAVWPSSALAEGNQACGFSALRRRGIKAATPLFVCYAEGKIQRCNLESFPAQRGKVAAAEGGGFTFVPCTFPGRAHKPDCAASPPHAYPSRPSSLPTLAPVIRECLFEASGIRVMSEMTNRTKMVRP